MNFAKYSDISNFVSNIPNVVASEVLYNSFFVFGNPCKFHWVVYGKRKNIEVEPLKENVILKGDGPYTYLVSKYYHTFFLGEGVRKI